LKWWHIAIACAVCALGGYAYGRHWLSSRVITKDFTLENNRLRIENAKLSEENSELKRHTVTVIDYAPTGKPLRKTVDTHVDKTVSTRTDVKINTDSVSAKLVEHTKIEEDPFPHWTASALAGIDLKTRTPHTAPTSGFNSSFRFSSRRDTSGCGACSALPCKPPAYPRGCSGED
jgi:hypothetical protein